MRINIDGVSLPVLSYFTLPFGQPIDDRVRVVPEGSSWGANGHTGE